MRAGILRTLTVAAFALAVVPAAASAQELSIGDVSVSEGDVGTTNMVFTLTSDVAAGPGGISARISTLDDGGAGAGSAASAGADYELVKKSDNKIVTIPEGETSKTFSIAIKGDELDENDETFLVVVDQVSGATMFDNKATGVIKDDDPDPNPDARVSVNDIQVTEGDSGITKGTFTVSLDRPAERVLEYDITSTNGETNGERSATPQIDFYANSDLIVFNPGEQTKTFSLDVLGDTVDEGDEYVVVRITLHGYEPGQINDGEGVLQILDDDPKPAPAAVAGAAAQGRVCLSRRNFTIRVRDQLYAKRRDVSSVTVIVDGRRVRSRFGRRITAFVDFRGSRKKTVFVDIALGLDDGTTIKRARVYRLCNPKNLDDGIPPLL
jgi:hypothetical protein